MGASKLAIEKLQTSLEGRKSRHGCCLYRTTDSRKPLRLWPGVALAVVLLATSFVVPLVGAHFIPYSMLGTVDRRRASFCSGGSSAELFFSRAPWNERPGAPAVRAVVLFVTWLAPGDPEHRFRPRPMAAATERRPVSQRWATMVMPILIGCGVCALIRRVQWQLQERLSLRWTSSPDRTAPGAGPRRKGPLDPGCHAQSRRHRPRSPHPSTAGHRAQTHTVAANAETPGPALLDHSPPLLLPLARRSRHRQALNRYRLATRRFSALLALAVPLSQRPAENRRRDSCTEGNG